MRRLISIVLTITSLIAAVPVVGQQQTAAIEWDFSYRSLLDNNKVAKNALFRRWWAGVKSPAEKWIKNWAGKSITSAILIEYPAFHAAERQTILLVRTADDAQYWELTEELDTKDLAEEAKVEEPFAVQIYDETFRSAWSWRQSAPKSAVELPEQVFPGLHGVSQLVRP